METPSPNQAAVEQAVSTGLQAIFPGDSEMARLMRSFDWSTTEVGVPENWPESLKAAVRICVGSRNPMVIWWGKKALTQIYNDGYMRILTAAKHPRWFAQSGAECWTEIMETMGPMWEQVLTTGEATWCEDFLYVMNRNLPREECYFTFSYSALRNDSGLVDGILCICYETTNRVVGDRRLHTLRDLGRTVSMAKTPEEACKLTAGILAANPDDIPFAMLYILDEDGRQARLVARCGLLPFADAAPDKINLSSSETSAWPLKRALDTGSVQTVSELSTRFRQLPTDSPSEFSETALVVPITSGGLCRGFLVAALSPRRIVDADYHSFLDLLAGHVGTAIGNAMAYDEARRRAEALAEIDRAKTTFFSNVSHEFRTPLTLILSPLEDALAAEKEPQQRARLELMCRNAMRLQKLVNTLLDFSRIEAGRIQASYEPTSLAEFTAELASSFRSAIERAGMRLVVDCPKFDEPVYVDRDMYEKIVLNLLSNAFKFTLAGEIRVALRRDGSSVELSVSDTGGGIAEDQLPHVFDRFQRIEGTPSRTHEGTGIGLALVQELVKLHGGSVGVTSIVGGGSTFAVRIPRGKAHLSADRIGATSSLTSTALASSHYVEEALRWLPDGAVPQIGEEPVGARPVSAVHGTESEVSQNTRSRILWADDNADMRDYVSRLLSPLYEVEAVPDGESALAAARRQPPDLILADIMMPRLDGLGLLRSLRADEATRSIPCILLSARAGEESRIEGADSGADDYLVKPFSARELVARVRAHLKTARLRRESETAVRESEQRYRDLLREVHHRVKNNLQVISSLLEMQASRTDNPQTAERLEESCNRVLSIATIHELIYRRDTFDRASLGDYSRDLTARLLHFYDLDRRIRFSVADDDRLAIELDRAVSCGLVLNELISNCCKHAFPSPKMGEITIRIGRRDQGIAIEIADDGIGFAAKEMASDSLGLKLVNTIVAQNLGGTVEFSSKRGTRVLIAFPERRVN